MLPTPRPRRRTRPARRRARPRAAGELLLNGLSALLLAALVNADALVDRAERRALGPARDRSLAIWHPVQDISHVLQLHRIRQLGDALAGNEDDHDVTVLTTTTIAPGATTTLPPRPELRTPTAAAPLRLWVGGDSIVRDFGESVLRLAAPDPLFEPVLHYEISTGLTRPDYFDWPEALVDDMAATDPEVVVIMFGANDGQGIVTADGTAIQQVSDPAWDDEYALRVGAVMDLLHEDEDRLVYWVLQPPMRDGGFDARIDIINAVYEREAEARPWIEIVATEPLIGDSNGGYADNLPGPGGAVADLRQGDGIHLSRAGADLLAEHVLGLIDAEISPGRPSATSSSTSTTRPG
jgi:hypothetical protein